MNASNIELAINLLGGSESSASTYIQLSQQAQSRYESAITTLLANRKLPESGWTDAMIESFLMQLSSMDSNNYGGNVGLGERESRIYSTLVAKRCHYMGHGIGRSGDINEVQPKAPGSSLMYRLTNALVLDAFRIAGAVSL